MNTIYDILLVLALIAAILFSGLVLITGKGDAMSGGSSGVRTSFKGKANFDDIMSQWTLGFGIAFMALTFVVDVLSSRMHHS